MIHLFFPLFFVPVRLSFFISQETRVCVRVCVCVCVCVGVPFLSPQSPFCRSHLIQFRGMRASEERIFLLSCTPIFPFSQLFSLSPLKPLFPSEEKEERKKHFHIQALAFLRRNWLVALSEGKKTRAIARQYK